MATTKIKSELTTEFDALKSKAKDKGLPLFLGVPEHNRPTAAWNGGWSSFVDLAAQAEARVIYVEKVRFDFEDDSDDESRVYSNLTQIYKERASLERGSQIHARPLDRGRPAMDLPDESLTVPTLAKLATWKQHQGEVVLIRCVWFKEAVAHEWQTTAKWLEVWQLAVRQAVLEAQSEFRETRNSLAQEDVLRLDECARRMAQHERFADAKSDAKRDFMAEQLFPNEDRVTRIRIVGLASLHYWWSIQPGETADKDEKARQLHRSGDSLNNIAAALDMSVAKVKRAVQSAPGS